MSDYVKQRKGKMEIAKDEVWAIIPARGGSKSIPLKNMVELGGRPLIDYVITAAKASRSITRIICSTDNERITEFCRTRGVEVHPRPDELARDDTPVLDVLRHILEDIGAKEGKVAPLVPLLQPTSPFLLPDHIDTCVEKLRADTRADSAQTISEFSHNYHAYNQRIIEDGNLRFRFVEERRICYNKQTKPKHYIFGNLIVTTAKSLIEKKDIFGDRSIPYIIPFYYSTDVDGPEELELAEWAIANGKIKLPCN